MKRVELNIYTQSGSYYCLVRHNKKLYHSSNFRTVDDAREWRDAFRTKNKKVSQGQYMKDNTTTKISYFEKRRHEIREERRYCERCEKDLKDANRFQWCVHHKDHDRANNIDENFELLCKGCHQKHHLKRNNLGRFTK